MRCSTLDQDLLPRSHLLPASAMILMRSRGVLSQPERPRVLQNKHSDLKHLPNTFKHTRHTYPVRSSLNVFCKNHYTVRIEIRMLAPNQEEVTVPSGQVNYGDVKLYFLTFRGNWSSSGKIPQENTWAAFENWTYQIKRGRKSFLHKGNSACQDPVVEKCRGDPWSSRREWRTEETSRR